MSADIADTLGLLISVLKFDIVECWTRDEHNVKCNYLFIAPAIRKLYPLLESINPSTVHTWRERSVQVWIIVCISSSINILCASCAAFVKSS